MHGHSEHLNCGTLSDISCSSDNSLENVVMQYYAQIPGKEREEKVKLSILLREMEKSNEIAFPTLHHCRFLAGETGSLAVIRLVER